MKMTNKLANTLMDCLACVAISANGGVEVDKNGNPITPEEQLQKVFEYAKETFFDILTPWEELMGEKWEIEEEMKMDEE